MSLILMQLENYHPSIEYLNQVIDYGGSYKRTGLWYLALAYLAIENYPACAESLDKLIESSEKKPVKQAKMLRKKLKKSL